MSAPYWHTCGAAVDVEIDRIGFDYSIQFRAPTTGKPLTQCPGCDRQLYAAYRNGELAETADHIRPTARLEAA